MFSFRLPAAAVAVACAAIFASGCSADPESLRARNKEFNSYVSKRLNEADAQNKLPPGLTSVFWESPMTEALRKVASTSMRVTVKDAGGQHVSVEQVMTFPKIRLDWFNITRSSHGHLIFDSDGDTQKQPASVTDSDIISPLITALGAAQTQQAQSVNAADERIAKERFNRSTYK